MTLKSTTDRLTSLRKRYVAVSFNEALEDEIKRLVLVERGEAREEAIRECAEICEKSVKVNNQGTAYEWKECPKTPYDLRDEILRLLEKKEGENK